MGLNLDLSNLTTEESEHILRVIHQDFQLRHREKDRLCDIESQIHDEELKSRILSQCFEFNNKSCIRCFSRFFIFFNKKHICRHCGFYVCGKCCDFDIDEKRYICKICAKEEEFQRQSGEWFYSRVCKKFKRCGSAKVFSHFYKQHLNANGNNVRSESCSELVSEWLQLMKDEKDETSWTHLFDGKEIHRNAVSLNDVRYRGDHYRRKNSLTDVSNCVHHSSEPDRRSSHTASKSTNTGDLDAETEQCCEDNEHSSVVKNTGTVNDNELLRLAEEVSKTQGKASSLAAKMLDSATMIQLMSEKLDEMDVSLQDLQTSLSELPGHDESISDDLQQQRSLDAVSGLTTTAFELLSHASDVFGGESISSDYFEQEQCHKTSGSISNPSLSDQHVLPSETPSELLPKTDKVPQLNDDTFRTIEHQIYVNSSEVFLLEEHLQELEDQVLNTDESTSADAITALENEIALTVAKVANRSIEVADIEKQVKDMLNE